MDSVQMWAIMHGEYSFNQLDSNLTKLGRILCFDYCRIKIWTPQAICDLDKINGFKNYRIRSESSIDPVSEGLLIITYSSIGFKSLKKNQSEFQMAPAVQFCLI